MWKAYESIKDNKINAKQYLQKQHQAFKLKSDDYYYGFTKLLGRDLSPSKYVVTEKEIEDYSQHVMYNLTAQGYSAWLSKQIGVKKKDILLLKPDGSYDVDISVPLVNAYIKKIGAEK